jgi:hypothetical protein
MRKCRALPWGQANRSICIKEAQFLPAVAFLPISHLLPRAQSSSQTPKHTTFPFSHITFSISNIRASRRTIRVNNRHHIIIYQSPSKGHSKASDTTKRRVMLPKPPPNPSHPHPPLPKEFDSQAFSRRYTRGTLSPIHHPPPPSYPDPDPSLTSHPKTNGSWSRQTPNTTSFFRPIGMRSCRDGNHRH